MRNLFYYLVLSFIILGSCKEGDEKQRLAQDQSPGLKPNVLFIAIDDMNDWTSLFDSENPIKVPTLEKLAKRGAFFTKAYCSSPACNPSRTSIMTGTRPHKTGVYGNNSDWRSALPESTTLQKLFMNNGYYVAGAGKIFHHKKDWAFHDNASFNEFLLMEIDKPYPPSKINGIEWFGSIRTDWGPWPEHLEETADYKTSSYAIQFLQETHHQPFFLNVGIYKPHSPWFVPEEFFTPYPKSKLEMPLLNESDVNDLPPGANTLMKGKKWFWNGMVRAQKENPESYREFVQAYQASATFADKMLSRVIEALDASPYANNTVIIVWSDHGFHLGEKEHIEKFALWEKSTHVPYIIIAPGQIAPGTVVEDPVDLTSIYPTLAALCNVQTPAVEGISLLPYLQNSTEDLPPALMTYMKGNHAVRTKRWRYIQYQDGSAELYDHHNDPNEWQNLAGEPQYSKIIEELKRHLPAHNAEQVEDM